MKKYRDKSTSASTLPPDSTAATTTVTTTSLADISSLPSAVAENVTDDIVTSAVPGDSDGDNGSTDAATVIASAPSDDKESSPQIYADLTVVSGTTATTSSPCISSLPPVPGIVADDIVTLAAPGDSDGNGGSTDVTTVQISAQMHSDLVALFASSGSGDIKSLLLESGKVDQLAAHMANHESVLNVLVGKQQECPQLIWLYPVGKSVWRWLKDPAGMLLSNLWMMVFVCPVTLKMVPCGPKGVGYELKNPKKWVKKFGPAILVTIKILQTALLAGRLLGIPVPSLSSVGSDVGLTFGNLSSSGSKDSSSQAVTAMLKMVESVGVEECMEWSENSF